MLKGSKEESNKDPIKLPVIYYDASFNFKDWDQQIVHHFGGTNKIRFRKDNITFDFYRMNKYHPEEYTNVITIDFTYKDKRTEDTRRYAIDKDWNCILHPAYSYKEVNSYFSDRFFRAAIKDNFLSQALWFIYHHISSTLQGTDIKPLMQNKIEEKLLSLSAEKAKVMLDGFLILDLIKI
jgi:hypothetical protein